MGTIQHTAMRAIVLTLLVLAAGCTEAGPESTAEPVPLRTLDVGQRTPIHEPGIRVIEDEATWRAFWEQHTRNNGTIEVDGQPVGTGSRPPPAIDFGQERAVAVFLGERPDMCYHLRVVEARGAEGTLTIKAREHLPDGSASCGLATVYPFHVVAVRGAGEVRLERETVRGPPAS